MAGVSFTKGPWSVVRAEVDEFDRDPHYKNGNFFVVNETDCDIHPIADCSCDHTCRLDYECEANARLIAAAPDLLDRHQRDMAELDLLAKAIHAGDPMPELVLRVVDMLNAKRAVIRAATGETE